MSKQPKQLRAVKQLSNQPTTVADLIAHLSLGHPSALVVAFDHFGRSIEIKASDFRFITLGKGDSPQGYQGEYLEVPVVDIGEEPE